MSHHKYRILVVAFCCSPNTGSEATTGWNWVSQLAAAGHTIYLLTTPESADNCKIALQQHQNIHLHTVNSPRLFACRVYDPQGRLLYIIWLKKALQSAIILNEEHHFDIVHHVTFGSLSMGSPFYRLPVKSVFGPIGGAQVAPWSFWKYLGTSWFFEMIRIALVRTLKINISARKTIKHTDCILCSNMATLNLTQHLGAKKPQIIFDFAMTKEELDNTRPKRRKPGPPYIALWVGRLVSLKALPLALDAMACLPKEAPVNLKIYGHGPQQPKLQKMICLRGLENRVEYCGSVPRNQMLTNYQSADFLIFTSLRDSGGAQISEAMANGLPIIFIDHPGASGAQSIISENAGIRVPLTSVEQTPKDLANAMMTLINSPSLADKLSVGARQRAEELSWSHRMHKIQTIYDQL